MKTVEESTVSSNCVLLHHVNREHVSLHSVSGWVQQHQRIDSCRNKQPEAGLRDSQPPCLWSHKHLQKMGVASPTLRQPIIISDLMQMKCTSVQITYTTLAQTTNNYIQDSSVLDVIWWVLRAIKALQLFPCQTRASSSSWNTNSDLRGSENSQQLGLEQTCMQELVKFTTFPPTVSQSELRAETMCFIFCPRAP